MIHLQLDYDEGILLESEGASWESREDIELTNLVLTNKNIYCTYEKNNGLFKKSTEEVNILSLSDIKIINGQALVQQIKHDGTWCLQIQFRQGTEYFSFYDSPKKIISQWINVINKSLGIVPSEVATISTPVQKSVKRNNPFGNVFAGAAGAFAGVADSLREVVDSASETLGINQTKQVTQESVMEYEQFQTDFVVPQQEEKQERKHSFCMNCGAGLIPGAKFCSSCGNKIGAIENDSTSTAENSVQTPPPIPEPQVQNTTPPPIPKSQRQQEYAGTIMKCPNCGSVIGETTVVCPDCGIRITGRSAVTSVQDFKDQLMTIEGTRKRGLGGVFCVYTAPDPADIKKLSLIRSFPIPNTVDDIMEFMFLAVANIDVSLSKNTAMNKWNNTQQVETGATIGRTISNAWVSKMQQAYQKAEIMFPNDPAFPGLQKLYFDKMKELKIKV